ncbi:MFS transporter [Sphingobium sp. SCG-1]|uniref:MFS transporter n=1 Tax=Sphingobium sp. SCG-1 TaxID=2072936 RepID=UPI001670037C|nr:MFS transporter [Sphingobium sp. SCG-1]
MLTVLYVFSYLDRFILTMLVPSVKASLKLSDFEMGIILGPAFAIVFAIAGVPLGWAADRYSRRWVILIGALIFGIATGVSGLATSFAALFLMRIFVGIGEASLTPAAMSLIADKMPRARLTTAISVFSMGPKIGSSAAYAIGGLALIAAGAIERSFPAMNLSEPWRLTLGVAAFPSILFAFLVFTFSEPRRAKRAVEASESGAVAFMVAKRGLMIPLTLGFCCIIICGQSLIAWVPTFIDRQFHWSPAIYGPTLGAISLAGAATLVPKGMIIDWLFKRGVRDAPIRFYTWLLMGTLPLAMVVFLLRNGTLFLLFYSIVAVVTIPLIAYFTTAVQMVTPKNLRGRVTALTSIPLALFGSLGPLIVGALTDFVFRDEARLGWSLTAVMSTMIPAALICMRYCLPALREAVDANEDNN